MSVEAGAAPAEGNGLNRTWLRWVAVGCVLGYMLSFGPVVWYANMTKQAPFRAPLIDVLGVVYAPHMWLAAQVQPYGEYCRWWQRLAQGGR